MAPRIRIITLGCKVNQCDGDEMGRSLAAAGFDLVPSGQADLYIVNTCTVTATADAKARKLIRKLAREHPGAKLVVTGCGADRDAEAVGMPGLVVVPNARKADIAELVARATVGGHAGMARSPEATATAADGVAAYPPYSTARTRAFLKIQDGCDHRCAYCAVPDARGRPVSKPLPEVLAELRRLAEGGAQEVVLCGIRLGAYGREGGGAPGLADLLRSARGIAIPRLRLSSVEPMDLDGDLLAEMAGHPRLCHHLHLPLQSGDDAVLAEMGRGYTTTDYARLVDRIRGAWPEAAITTDVMAGFPGETEMQFQSTVDFAQEIGFSRVHVFPYSPRPGAPAAQRRDQTPAAVKRQRAERLLMIGAQLAQRAATSWVGREVRVLFEERDPGGALTGLTDQYLRVRCHGPSAWLGRIVPAEAKTALAGELMVVANQHLSQGSRR